MTDPITTSMARYEGLEFDTAGVAVPKKPAQAILLADFLTRHGMAFGHTMDTAIGAIMKGMELGKPPTWALQNIAVIRGKPAIWGAGLKALAMEHPACANRLLSGCYSAPEIGSVVGTANDGEGDVWEMRRELQHELAIRFKAMPERQRQQPGYFCGWAVAMRGDVVAVSLFDSNDAEMAGLGGKGSMYEKWPRRMLAARAVGFLIRDLFPEAMVTDMTREEADDEERLAAAPRVSQVVTRSAADLITVEEQSAAPIDTEYSEVETVHQEPVAPEEDLEAEDKRLRGELKDLMAAITASGRDASKEIAHLSGGRSWRVLSMVERRKIVDDARRLV